MLILLVVWFFLPSSLIAQKPNILLIVSDDLNTNIGPYMDIANHTPNLDRLADQGVDSPEPTPNIPFVDPQEHLL